MYLVLAFYHLEPIVEPFVEVTTHKTFFENRDISSRIYISEQGINGQMCGSVKDAQAYMDWMHDRPEFKNILFKIHQYHEQVFPRKTVKYRKQLVAIDENVDLANRGTSVSPAQWRKMLESKEERILIDVRNDYEWKVGRFEGAELPPCETFREFSTYIDTLKEKGNAKTPVMMYCTGGIRCELFSAVLKQKGFENVYQLDGGIIGYGLNEGNAHWLGKLFVFDDRLTVPIAHSEETTPVIGTCHHCQKPNESYYNCASMDCNELFLCCPECLKIFGGCCGKECSEGPRVRPYHAQNPHKPFRRRHHYENTKKISSL